MIEWLNGGGGSHGSDPLILERPNEIVPFLPLHTWSSGQPDAPAAMSNSRSRCILSDLGSSLAVSLAPLAMEPSCRCLSARQVRLYLHTWALLAIGIWVDSAVPRHTVSTASSDFASHQPLYTQSCILNPVDRHSSTDKASVCAPFLCQNVFRLTRTDQVSYKLDYSSRTGLGKASCDRGPITWNLSCFSSSALPLFLSALLCRRPVYTLNRRDQDERRPGPY